MTCTLGKMAGRKAMDMTGLSRPRRRWPVAGLLLALTLTAACGAPQPQAGPATVRCKMAVPHPLAQQRCSEQPDDY